MLERVWAVRLAFTATLLVSLPMSVTDALECYTCGSLLGNTVQESCPDNFLSLIHGTESCGSSFLGLDSPTCLKLVSNNNVVRACSNGITRLVTGLVCNEQIGDTALYCCDDADGCNHSPPAAHSISTSLILMAAIIPAILRY